MTAVPLFDAVAHAHPAAAGHGTLLARFAGRLVATALADLDRVREYEQEFAAVPRSDPDQELAVRQTIWRLYAEWAEDADRILTRARDVASSGGATVAGTDKLGVAVGRVRARLTVLPEQTARAIGDARAGRTIPMKELRDERRARLRA